MDVPLQVVRRKKTYPAKRNRSHTSSAERTLRTAILLMTVAAFSTHVHAQMRFGHPDHVDRGSEIPLPKNAIAIVRFETAQPIRVTEVSAWLASAHGGSFDLLVFGNEGGSAFPYQLHLLSQPIHVTVSATSDSLYRFRMEPPVPLGGPGQFFVGVLLGSDGMTVRTSMNEERIPCVGRGGDTLFTSAFAIFDSARKSYAFGAHLADRMRIDNWCIGALADSIPRQRAPLFRDITAEAGLGTMTEGTTRIAWGDFDGDGKPDLLSGQHLFRNSGDGTFSDVSLAAGFRTGSEINLFADVDNDGDLDIVCEPAGLVYRNTTGIFTADSLCGLHALAYATAMCMADVNGDGFVDLFVAGGPAAMSRLASLGVSSLSSDDRTVCLSHLYFNDGRGGFHEQSGCIDGFGVPTIGKTGVSGGSSATCAQWVDFDNDGDADLFVGNTRLEPDGLYENLGNGMFRSVARDHGIEGTAKAEYADMYGNTQGCDFADYNNDGTMDLITACEAEPYRIAYSDVTTIRRNDGARQFRFVDTKSVTHLAYNAHQADAAWGDFDNDGRLDLIITSGERCRFATLYRQNADGSFTDVTAAAGVMIDDAFGAGWADVDADGKLDLACATGTGVRLFRNISANAGNWVELDLKSRRTRNSPQAGDRINLFTRWGMQTREIAIGRSAGCQEPLVQHFGLGSATDIDSVVITWAGGARETFVGIPINRRSIIRQDGSSSVPDPPRTASSSRQNFPNAPSKSENSATVIAYNLPESSNIRLEIHDSTGTLIAVLVDTLQNAGLHYVAWDGFTTGNRRAENGTYQYVLMADGTVRTRQPVILR